MRRYITYNGVSSEEFGIKLISMPLRYSAAVDGESKTVSGRDGDVFITGKNRKPYNLDQKCTARRSRLSEISAWLSYSGTLVFSDEPALGIDARIVDEVQFKRLTNDNDPLYAFTVTFMCQPHYRIIPEAEEIVVTRQDELIHNPYFAPSRPRIVVEGRGDITLNIGEYTLYLSDVEDGIILDSELMDAFTYDGTLLSNNQVDGELPLLKPGGQYVSWDGEVTEIRVTPRWRTT